MPVGSDVVTGLPKRGLLVWTEDFAHIIILRSVSGFTVATYIVFVFIIFMLLTAYVMSKMFFFLYFLHSIPSEEKKDHILVYSTDI